MSLMFVGGAILGSAVIGAGVSLYEGAQQQGIANSALGLAQQTQAKQNYYNDQLMQMLANPGKVLSDPAFTAATNVGSSAVAHQNAAQFGPNSGNEAAALQSYGQGAGLSFIQQQEQLLASLSGAQSASSPAQSLGVATDASKNAAGTAGAGLYGAGALMSMYGSGGGGAAFTPLNDPSLAGGTAGWGAGANAIAPVMPYG